jgi:hypothetical protein
MTVLSPSQIVGMALPSLAPSSSGPSGAGLGGQIHDTWQNSGIKQVVKTRKERRAAIAKARAAVEARSTTKHERLASGPARETGSSKERNATKGVIADAQRRVSGAATSEMWNDPEFREARAKLRARYPGRKLSEMLAIGEQITASFHKDPIAAREELLAAFARLPTRQAYEPAKHANSARASVARAAQDQADIEDLRQAAERHGIALPRMIKELEVLDNELAADPAGESARIAVRFGAPVVESEVAPFQQKQAAKAQAAKHESMHNAILHGIDLVIKQGLISGEPAHLNKIAAVLTHKDFPWAEHRKHQDFNFRALLHADHVAKQMQSSKNRVWDAGQKSISGAPGPGQGGRTARGDAGTGSARDSIARARGR